MATPIVEKPLTAEAAARRAGVAAGLVALAGGALTLNHMLPGCSTTTGCTSASRTR